ncbi:MAG: response regulator [Cyanobacteria bacterium P01_G01_bin.67]
MRVKAFLAAVLCYVCFLRQMRLKLTLIAQELQSMNMKVRRILIIHADEVIKEMLLLCLETISDYEVIAVNSGIEGIEKAQSVDAILLDVDQTMPDLCWREIVQCLLQNSATNSLPLILLTATPQTPELSELQKVKSVKAIAESFDLMTTAARVTAMLNWK